MAEHIGTIKEGIRLYRTKRFDAALAELLAVDSSALEPDTQLDLAYYLGLCYTKLERFDDALLYLEQVVTGAADPLRTYQCRLVLAYVYTMTNRSRMAEFELRKLLETGYESVQIYTSLGFAAWKQKRQDIAVGFYQKALDMDAGNATALNGLGFILCETELDTRKGLNLCKQAVEKRPQNAAYLDSMGWAFYKNGEILEARTWLRRALDLNPRNPEIAAHMRLVMGEDLS